MAQQVQGLHRNGVQEFPAILEQLQMIVMRRAWTNPIPTRQNKRKKIKIGIGLLGILGAN